jgi:hypothetical protein
VIGVFIRRAAGRQPSVCHSSLCSLCPLW